MEELDKYVRGIVKKIDEMKGQCGTTQEFLKRDEVLYFDNEAHFAELLREEVEVAGRRSS